MSYDVWRYGNTHRMSISDYEETHGEVRSMFEGLDGAEDISEIILLGEGADMIFPVPCPQTGENYLVLLPRDVKLKATLDEAARFLWDNYACPEDADGDAPGCP